MNSKFRLILSLLIIALVFGGGLGLFLSRQTSSPQLPPTTVIAVPDTIQTVSTQEVMDEFPARQEVILSEAAQVPPATTNWEQKLDEVLVSDGDPASKAANILALIPEAPEEGKVQLAQHLVNMVEDANYAATGELLTNTNTPSSVSSILMNDLLNRNNQLKLPTLLAVAREENHPLRKEAKDMLELFIQEDKGENWEDWQTAVDKWLLENP